MSHPIRIHAYNHPFRTPTSGYIDHIRVGDFVERDFPSEVPPRKTRRLKCQVEAAPGVVVHAMAWGNHIFVDSGIPNRSWNDWVGYDEDMENPEKLTEPFIKAEVTGTPHTRIVDKYAMRNSFTSWAKETDQYDPQGSHYSDALLEGTGVPYVWIPLRVTAKGAEPVDCEFCFKQPETGVAKLADSGPGITVVGDICGFRRTWSESLAYEVRKYKQDYNVRPIERSNNPLEIMYRHLKGSVLPDGKDVWWARFFETHGAKFAHHPDMLEGLSATLKNKLVKPVMENLAKNYPLDYQFFQWLQNGVTTSKQRNNALLAAFLLKMQGDFDGLVAALQTARNDFACTTDSQWHYGYSENPETEERFGLCFQSRRAICLSLPGASDKVQELEAKADWTKRKGNAAQADGLGVSETQFPLLRAAIEAGQIPLSIFHQPDKTPVNIEFPLWEKALARPGWAEILYEVAADAGRRTTYEKDITPYISFLFKIERYLEKHTGRTWMSQPKYVESESDLEMDSGEEDETAENGTTKRRSAFTPVADNETNAITVPYVAVSISGVRTQWCYARHYYLFEDGFADPESGGMIYQDLEKKLNGRDDYGLCYYDLIGTSTATGYPTFLIIFERLPEKLLRGQRNRDCPSCFPQEHGVTDNRFDYPKPGCTYHFPQRTGGTRVHFHRVHPKRVVGGKQTPACKLIETCYQYMAGNVPAQDVVAQQGDLIFLRHPNDPIAAGAKVKEAQIAARIGFESHNFMPREGTVSLFESTAKTPGNRLGFIHVPVSGMAVKHPEHDDIDNLGEGWYEIRRCKSWEANPVSIWTLTID